MFIIQNLGPTFYFWVIVMVVYFLVILLDELNKKLKLSFNTRKIRNYLVYGTLLRLLIQNYMFFIVNVFIELQIVWVNFLTL